MARPVGSRSRLTERMKEAAVMMAHGETAPVIAKKVGVTIPTVWAWMKRDDVQAIYREAMRNFLRVGYSRSIKKIDSLIDNDNDWLSLQASQAMAARAEAVAMGSDAQSGVQITINQGTGSAPVLGMPDRPTEDGGAEGE